MTRGVIVFACAAVLATLLAAAPAVGDAAPRAGVYEGARGQAVLRLVVERRGRGLAITDYTYSCAGYAQVKRPVTDGQLRPVGQRLRGAVPVDRRGRVGYARGRYRAPAAFRLRGRLGGRVTAPRTPTFPVYAYTPSGRIEDARAACPYSSYRGVRVRRVAARPVVADGQFVITSAGRFEPNAPTPSSLPGAGRLWVDAHAGMVYPGFTADSVTETWGGPPRGDDGFCQTRFTTPGRLRPDGSFVLDGGPSGSVRGRVAGDRVSGTYEATVGGSFDCSTGVLAFTGVRAGTAPAPGPGGPEPLPPEPAPGLGQAFGGPPAATEGCRSEVRASPVVALAGCWTQRDGRWESRGRVRVNGIDVTPTGGAVVVLDPDGPSVTSRGAVDVRVGGTLLYRGTLARAYAIRDTTLFEVGVGPGLQARDNVIGGLPVRGTVKLTLDPAGATVGQVTVGLPGPLAGADGSVTFRADNATGLGVDALRLSSRKLTLGLVLSLEDVELTYAPDTGRWDGAATIFPPMLRAPRPCGGLRAIRPSGSADRVQGALLKLGISGRLGFGTRDDYFRLGAGLDGLNCRGPWFVFLQKVAAEVAVDPLSLGFDLGATLGPEVRLPGLEPLAVASVDYGGDQTQRTGSILPASSTGRLALLGRAPIWQELRLDGEATLSPGSLTSRGTGTFKPAFVPEVFRSDVAYESWFTGDSFTYSGTSRAAVAGLFDSTGRWAMTPAGAALCGRILGVPVGWGWRWSEPRPRVMDGVCDLAPFTATRAGHQAASGFRIGRGQAGAVVAVGGDGGAPSVTVRGPGLEATADAAAPSRTDRLAVLPDPENATTYLVLPRPRAGTYTVATIPGSPAVTAVRATRPLPRVAVRGQVRRTGRARRLRYRINGLQRGDRVRFAVRDEDGARPAGSTVTRRGTLPLPPSPQQGRVTLTATLERAGTPQPLGTVARYRAAAADRLAAPRGVRVTRRGDGALVRWRGPRRTYEVRARLSDGRRLRWSTDGRSQAVRPLARSTRVRVSVRATDVLGRRGPARSARG